MRSLWEALVYGIQKFHHGALVNYHVVRRESPVTPLGTCVLQSSQLRKGASIVCIANSIGAIALHEICLPLLIERTEITEQERARVPNHVVLRQTILMMNFGDAHLQELL